MRLNLLHLANTKSTNIGNGALILGTEKLLQEDFSTSISWIREPWDDYTFEIERFDSLFVDKVNQSDGMIAGGAVAFNGREYLKNAGMRFDLPFELWSQLKKPVVFYGLSYRHWRGQPYHHAGKLKTAIEKILSLPNMIFSVRNDGTKRWLEQTIGIASSKIYEIPDPGMFVPALKKKKYPEFQSHRKNVIVSFNDEDSRQRFKNSAERSHILDALVSTIESLSRAYKLNIVLVPHYFDDYKMMSDFIDRSRPQLAHQCMVTTGLCRIGETEEFYGRYCNADLIICMRVHAMSPSIGHGLPVIPIVTQNRMWDFLDKVGLTGIGVDAFETRLADTLTNRAQTILDGGSNVKSLCIEATNFARKEVSEFNKKVERLFCA